jgi:hypothetical protein
MKIKTFYIASQATINGFTHPVHGNLMFDEHHAIPVDDTDPNGLQLIVAYFPTESVASSWVNTPGVQALPHPMNNSAIISADHFNLLKGKFGTLPTDTVWNVANKAGAFHALFKLAAFF